VAVDDADIIRWRGVLAKREGVYAESTSAAAFVGLEKLVEDGTIPRGDSVLVPVTGSGLKEPL
jgi:threonine synthase